MWHVVGLYVLQPCRARAGLHARDRACIIVMHAHKPKRTALARSSSMLVVKLYS